MELDTSGPPSTICAPPESPVEGWTSPGELSHWVLDSPEFKAWYTSAYDSVLTVIGGIGSGKSTFVRAAQHFLREANHEPATCNADSTSLSPGRAERGRLLLSALDEWCHICNNTGGEIVKPHDIVKSREATTEADPLPANSKKSPFFIIVDDIDELWDCIERYHQLKHILNRSIHGKERRSLKLLLTSKVDIRNTTDSQQLLAITLRGPNQENAIAKYVCNRYRGGGCGVRKESYVCSPEIIKLANGSFFCIKLLFDGSQNRWNPFAYWQFFNGVGLFNLRQLHHMYTSILDSAPDSGLARKLVMLVALTGRPLYLPELRALALLLDDDVDKRFDLSVLSGSLLTQCDDGTVSLVHATLKDYILSNESGMSSSQVAQCREWLTAVCLQTFNFQIAGETSLHSPFPALYRYAIDYWKFHYDQAEAESRKIAGRLHEVAFKSLSAASLDDKSPVRPWPQALTALSINNDAIDCNDDLLRLGVFYGFSKFSKLQIEMGANTNVQDDRGETPLFQAAARGNLKILEMLLKAGADPLHETRTGQTPLFAAITHGHVSCVEHLVRHIQCLKAARGSSEVSFEPVTEDEGEWVSVHYPRQSTKQDLWNNMLQRDDRDSTECGPCQLELIVSVSKACSVCDRVQTNLRVRSCAEDGTAALEPFTIVGIAAPDNPFRSTPKVHGSHPSLPLDESVPEKIVPFQWFTGNKMSLALKLSAGHGFLRFLQILQAVGDRKDLVKLRHYYKPARTTLPHR